MTTLRAIIYCRVSSKEQTFNLSLPVQEEQCRAFCKANGWEVDRVFLERGESAKTANRTELQAALAYLREQNKRAPSRPTSSSSPTSTASPATPSTTPSSAATWPGSASP